MKKKYKRNLVVFLLVLAVSFGIMGITPKAADATISGRYSGTTAYASLTNVTDKQRFGEIEIYNCASASKEKSAKRIARDAKSLLGYRVVSTSGTMTMQHVFAEGYLHEGSSLDSTPGKKYKKIIRE